MRGLRGLGIQGLANPVFSAGCPGGVVHGALFDPMLSYNPILYLPMDEAAGTTAINYGSLGLPANGTYSGVNLAQIAAPGGGLAPYFDGVSGYVNILTAALQGAYNGELITVVSWWKVYAQAQWTDAQIRQIVKLWTDANNNIRVEKYISDNWYVAWYNAGGTLDYRVDVSSNNTNWHMSALTVSNAADQYKMYTDGVQVSSTQTGIGDWAGALTSALIGIYTTAGSYPWKGYISNTAIYSSILTLPQINSLYTIGSAP